MSLANLIKAVPKTMRANPLCILQNNSCLARKHAFNIVEGKDRSLNKNPSAADHHKLLSKNIHSQLAHIDAAEEESGSNQPAEIDEGELDLQQITLVKAGHNNNMVLEEDTNYELERAYNAHKLDNSPHKTILIADDQPDKLKVANQDLAQGSATNSKDLSIRILKTQVATSVSAQLPASHAVQSSGAHVDRFPPAFKKRLTPPARPNIATIERHKDQVFALAVCGDLLYTASESKDIRVFRAPIFEELDCFGSGSGTVQSLMAFQETLYSAHQDNKIRVWKRVKSSDRRCKHKLVTVLPRLEHCVKSMLLQRNYVQVRRHKRKLWIEHADRISALALGGGHGSRGGGNDGRCQEPSVLYSASWDRTVKVWSLNNFKCMESFHAHHDAINAMLVIDGSILVTASADRTIKLWTKLSYPTRKKKHGLINTMEGQKAAVNALAISADSKVLYSGGADGTVMVWKKVYSGWKGRARGSMKRGVSGGGSGDQGLKQKNGREKLIISRGSSLAQELSNLNYSCDTAMSRNESGEVSIGSSGSGEMNMISRANSLTSHGLSSIKRVIGYNLHNRLHAWSCGMVNFTMKKALRGHTRSVLSVSTVGDNIVCSSSADTTIRVWVRAGERRSWEYACSAVLAGHGGPVKAIASVSRPLPAHHQHQSAAAASAALAPLAAAEDGEPHIEPDVIVYSGGLDSKVKVWALNTHEHQSSLEARHAILG